MTNGSVLLTGFESYGGRDLNPAEQVVKCLDGRSVAGMVIIGRTLPVRYEGLDAWLEALISETAPRAVIGFGLWPGEPMLRLERVAVNVADFEIGDINGALIEGAIRPNGVSAFETTLPIRAMRQRLLEAGIPCRLSSSAGTFLCNALMYTALRICAERRPSPLCGFVHIPYVPEQVATILMDLAREAQLEQHQRADLASMPLETTLQAALLAIETALQGTPDA